MFQTFRLSSNIAMMGFWISYDMSFANFAIFSGKWLPITVDTPDSKSVSTCSACRYVCSSFFYLFFVSYIFLYLLLVSMFDVVVLAILFYYFCNCVKQTCHVNWPSYIISVCIYIFNQENPNNKTKNWAISR